MEMTNVVCGIRKTTAEFRNELKTCNEDRDEANKTKKTTPQKQS